MSQIVKYGPDDLFMGHGSSLMGYCTTTYDNLVARFGEPNCVPGDKTWNSWDLCFSVHDDAYPGDSEDFYVSIYDWKESHPDHSRFGEYRWHIGGFHGKDHRADWMVTDLLEGDDSQYSFVRLA